MSGIVKIEVITGMSKLTDLIQNLSKVGVRGATVMQVLGCGIEMGTPEYEVERNEVMELLPKHRSASPRFHAFTPNTVPLI